VSLNIWTQCAGKSNFLHLKCRACRIVENQYQSATRRLVDSNQEHKELEEAIESVKPPLPDNPSRQTRHFLLTTPFRYPPLPHGSRFGTRRERGLWYGSLKAVTALAEAAYDRLRLLNDTTAIITSISEHTLYWTHLESKAGIDLTRVPFKKHLNRISSKTSYKPSQPLGTAMRNDGVEFFQYVSARDHESGINVGAFSMNVFKDPTLDHSEFQNWHCYANAKRAEYTLQSFTQPESHVFNFSDFTANGVFPRPQA
jgi:hypothetical protein